MRGGQIHTRDSSLGSASRTRYDRQIENVPGKFSLGSMPVNRAVEEGLALGGGFQPFRHIVVERFATQQEPSGRVADNLGVRVLDGCEHALGHSSAVQVHV